ncbi:MAG: hypothetical protein KDA96_22420 [Planctomycetaceae bacterium]|nr:hypothetical protein [Planctomycetaceae bacterium]
MSDPEEFLDNVFLGCAFKAYVEEAARVQGPPCPLLTRQLAYRYYEESLAERQHDRGLDTG